QALRGFIVHIVEPVYERHIIMLMEMNRRAEVDAHALFFGGYLRLAAELESRAPAVNGFKTLHVYVHVEVRAADDAFAAPTETGVVVVGRAFGVAGAVAKDAGGGGILIQVFAGFQHVIAALLAA